MQNCGQTFFNYQAIWQTKNLCNFNKWQTIIILSPDSSLVSHLAAILTYPAISSFLFFLQMFSEGLKVLVEDTNVPLLPADK
jgi:hypothetical protein